MERVFYIFLGVLNSEIVPLGIRLAIKVGLHGEVVRMLAYLGSTLQVSTLEAALKN